MGQRMQDKGSTFIVSIASPKGGAGKTVTTILLAAEFAAAGLSVLIIDADVQGSALGWFRASKAAKFKLQNIDVVAAPSSEEVMERLEAIREKGVNADVVLIDVQGTAQGTIGLAVQNSDLMIIPTRMHKFDVDQAIALVKHIKGLAGRGRVTPHRILCNAVNAIEKNGAAFKLAEVLLQNAKVEILPVNLSFRPTYQAVASAGNLYEVANPSKAVIEARNASRELFNAIVTVLNETSENTA